VNVADHLDESVLLRPDAPAILFEGQRFSYRELDARVSRAAHLLTGLGVGAGDRVALFLPNIPEFCVAYLAAQKLGAVAVSINVMSRAAELRYLLADSGAVALFTTAGLMAEVTPVRAGLAELRAVIICEGESAAGLTLEAAADRPDRFPTRAMSAGDPAAILYTSGTTGKPKGAVLTHGNILSNTRTTARCVGGRPGDRHALFLPLFHCFGQNFIMNAAFCAGGTVVLERRFELESTVAALAEHGVTHLYGVPTIFIHLINAGVGPERLPGVRYFFSAAATMPREVAAAWRDRFGQPIHEGYGLTETAPFASYNHHRAYRLGSIGVPIEGVEMKIVDEEGRPRGPGEWGEICIKGPNVMAGYFRNEEATRQVLRDGWFHTGDIGYRDEDGYYHLVDRKKDMINCAGFKVWPREVEEVLYQHPAVEECAVAAAPDPVRGESVRAFIKLRASQRASAAELRAHCEARMARYKIPGDFVFDRPIPRNPSGKILKRLLREPAADGGRP
jgi:long-chain acyl-CoA synthetase